MESFELSDTFTVIGRKAQVEFVFLILAWSILSYDSVIVSQRAR